MANYKVKIPGGVYEVVVVDKEDSVEGRKLEKFDAIDKAVAEFNAEIKAMVTSGDIYRVPEVYRKVDED